MNDRDNIVILMQARTSSARLPAKVLLPVAGYPLAVLAAKRASNTGINLIVVTSSEPDDDLLCRLLLDQGMRVYRGSLNNVLNRFVSSTTDLVDSTIVIRTTADNVFPDGNLIEELVAKYKKMRVPYLQLNGLEAGVPYGLSAEITKLKYIREANSSEPSQFDREHVTSYVRRKYGSNIFRDSPFKGFGNLRCTIDFYDDYIKIAKIFAKFSDPVNATLLQLLSDLANVDQRFSPSKSCFKLVIGGAQFGLDYGITNRDGQPSVDKVAEILRFCIGSGSRFIDTAADYGNSEIRIGGTAKNGWRQDSKVVTKFRLPFENDFSLSKSEIWSAIEKSILQSCYNLNMKCLDVLMFHRASDLKICAGYALHVLIKQKEAGLINDIGVSVQSPEELLDALRIPDVSFIQMPFNILDDRWKDAISQIYETKRARSLTIHCRSALLQGLIGSDKVALWSKAGIENYHEIKKWFAHHSRLNKCKSPLELAIRYVVSNYWVDGIVIGFESVSQAQEVVGYLSKGPLPLDSLAALENTRPSVYRGALDPSTWEVN